MLTPRQAAIPSLVRVKPGALDRLGIYAERHGFVRAAFLFSSDLKEDYLSRLTTSLGAHSIAIVLRTAVNSAAFEEASENFLHLPPRTDLIIGLGGGKALDVAKYVGFLARIPYFAVPTSLSNDGICSAQSSLTVEGRRRSLPSAMPAGVIIDTAVCLAAPEFLWHSGIGDLVAKFTAVADWKLAFHAVGEPVDDFAALLSDASVFQFLGRPERDQEGMRLLGTALMLNGISMALSGSSRPASGSEHLISHALDELSRRPRLHGLQVGIATYLMSLVQGQNTETIARLFDATGFWRSIEAAPFDRREWIEAVRAAPGIKADYYTIFSSRDCLPEIEHAIDTDLRLRRCFVRSG
ncbi:iron-containing alcohol dehydrogenase family protein [Verrucomicrobiota bacterium sgz303538]